MDLLELKVFVDEWLSTLSDDRGYWDGVYSSDRSMGYSFMYHEGRSFLKFAEKKYEDGYQSMTDVAKEYYRLLQQGKDADPQEKERIKMKLDELIAPYSDNIAYHAFLKMERMAAGLGKGK